MYLFFYCPLAIDETTIKKFPNLSRWYKHIGEDAAIKSALKILPNKEGEVRSRGRESHLCCNCSSPPHRKQSKQMLASLLISLVLRWGRLLLGFRQRPLGKYVFSCMNVLVVALSCQVLAHWTC